MTAPIDARTEVLSGNFSASRADAVLMATLEMNTKLAAPRPGDENRLLYSGADLWIDGAASGDLKLTWGELMLDSFRRMAGARLFPAGDAAQHAYSVRVRSSSSSATIQREPTLTLVEFPEGSVYVTGPITSEILSSAWRDQNSITINVPSAESTVGIFVYLPTPGGQGQPGRRVRRGATTLLEVDGPISWRHDRRQARAGRARHLYGANTPGKRDRI